MGSIWLGKPGFAGGISLPIGSKAFAIGRSPSAEEASHEATGPRPARRCGHPITFI